MTNFRAPILRGLEGIYRFVGSQVMTRAVELDRPITLVHDVSGMVSDEVGDYFTYRDSMHHTSAGNIRATIDPYEEATSVGVGWPKDRSTVFLCSYQHIVTATADFDDATLALALPASYGSQAQYYTLAYGDITIPKPAAAADGFPVWAGGEPKNQSQYRLPLHIPLDADIQVSSTSSGTPSFFCYIDLLFWVGPKGLKPPGL